MKRSIPILLLLVAIALPAKADHTQYVNRFGKSARIGLSVDENRLATVGNIAVRAPKKNVAQAAQWFWTRHRDLFGDKPGMVNLTLLKTTKHLDQHIVRFQPTLADMPIFGRSVILQIDETSVIRRVTSDVPLIITPKQNHPLPDEKTVRGWVENRNYQVDVVVGPGWLYEKNLTPVIRVDTADMDDPLSLFLDAHSGRIIATEPLLWTADPVGAVFPENPLTTPDVELRALKYLDPETDRLYGTYAHADSCVDRENCKELRPIARKYGPGDGSFIYKPNLDEYTYQDPFAEVNAYHNITTVSRWMYDTFGWEPSFNDETWIQLKIGRGDWYNAAYYGGSDKRAPYIVFGQDLIDFSYDADTAYHEFGHAINDLWNHSWLAKDELGINLAMSGIEEGLADIWAQQLSGDPVMNSYVQLARSAINYRTCPNSLMAEGHMAAYFVSAVGWNIRSKIGAEPWGHILYRTVSFLESEIGYDDFANGLVNSANDLISEGVDIPLNTAEIIIEEATARGLFDDHCQNRIVPLHENERKRVYGYGSKRTGGHDYPFGLQWKITAPDDGSAFTLLLYWRHPISDEVEPGFNVHIRRGSPVNVTWIAPDDLKDDEPAFTVEADYTFDEAPSEIDFPTMGMAALEPGEEIYVLLSSATEESTVVIDSTVYFHSYLPLPKQDDTDSGFEQLNASSNDGSMSCFAANPGFSTPSVFTELIRALFS